MTYLVIGLFFLSFGLKLAPLFVGRRQRKLAERQAEVNLGLSEVKLANEQLNLEQRLREQRGPSVRPAVVVEARTIRPADVSRDPRRLPRSRRSGVRPPLPW